MAEEIRQIHAGILYLCVCLSIAVDKLMLLRILIRMRKSHIIIANELKRRRLTLRGARYFLGKSHQAIDKWIKGKAEPSEKTLLNWASDDREDCIWVRDLGKRLLEYRGFRLN